MKDGFKKGFGATVGFITGLVALQLVADVLKEITPYLQQMVKDKTSK